MILSTLSSETDDVMFSFRKQKDWDPAAVVCPLNLVIWSRWVHVCILQHMQQNDIIRRRQHHKDDQIRTVLEQKEEQLSPAGGLTSEYQILTCWILRFWLNSDVEGNAKKTRGVTKQSQFIPNSETFMQTEKASKLTSAAPRELNGSISLN